MYSEAERAEIRAELNDIKIEHIASIAHAANAEYSSTLGQPQKTWDELDESTKASVRDGVRYLMNHPTAPAGVLHMNWLKFKEEEGKAGGFVWTYDEVKDLTRHTHPCMLPFDQLPAKEQVKDHLFRAVVSAYLNPTFLVTVLHATPVEKINN